MLLSVNIPGKQVFVAAPLCCNRLPFYRKISSHCIPIPVWWKRNSWIEWTRIRDFIQMQLRSLGLSMNSNVWVLQWNSSENHSIHPVGDFFLKSAPSSVTCEKITAIVIIYLLYLYSNARPKYWFKTTAYFKQCFSPPASISLCFCTVESQDWKGLDNKWIAVGESTFISPLAVFIYKMRPIGPLTNVALSEASCGWNIYRSLGKHVQRW